MLVVIWCFWFFDRKKQLRHKILDGKHGLGENGNWIQLKLFLLVLAYKITKRDMCLKELLPFQKCAVQSCCHLKSIYNISLAHIVAYSFIYLLMKCIRKYFKSLMVIEAFKKNPYANQSRLNSGFNEHSTITYSPWNRHQFSHCI